MRYLFVHQNFPGQFLHLIRRLQAEGGHDIVFISEPNPNQIPGVRRVVYRPPEYPLEPIHPHAREWDRAVRRAELVAGVARNLKSLGFEPDVIVGHHGWGELLDLKLVFPGVPILGYFEFYYSPTGLDVGFDPEFPADDALRARIPSMNQINHAAIALGEHGHSPTRWQLTRYPPWARGGIRLLEEGVALDDLAPDPAARRRNLRIGDFTVGPRDRLVTYVARNLEPYRGYHTMMRALPSLLKRKDVKVVMVGGNDVSYGARLGSGSWRDHFLKEMEGKYDASRVLLPGQVPYPVYRGLLKRSDAHVYLTYPFVVSWSLREAMGAGCAIVAADVESVREFITDDDTGVLTPALDPEKLAGNVLGLLEDRHRSDALRHAARAWAEQHLRMEDYLDRYEALIAEITGPAAERQEKKAATKQAVTPPAVTPPAVTPKAAKPAARKPVVNKAVAKKPVARKPVATKAVARKPVAKKPSPKRKAARRR